MIIFLSAVLALVLGYAFYGLLIEKILHIDTQRLTPAVSMKDGVDFVPIKPYKAFLIQFLNIAGLGPVLGPILGALYGPSCLLWIVFGSIFAGGVHDMLAGTISMRYNGQTMTTLAEKFLGKNFSYIFLVMLIFLLLLVGSIFAQTPAHMLSSFNNWSFTTWLIIIFGYYFLATLLPVDKIIGNFYPLFAACLIISSGALFVVGVLSYPRENLYPNLSLTNQHPNGLPMFPLMFITIACGALSGFHATQSPLISRCLTNEKYARPIFYGGMILEGVVALIWATLGISFYNGSAGLNEALGTNGNAVKVIKEIAFTYLGNWGGLFTVASVIILAITSGDTAFRSVRLSCADCLKLDQKNIKNRLLLTAVILAAGTAMAFCDLNKIWIYFGWSNQMLATLMLWIGTIYLRQQKWTYQVSLIPAIFMTFICGTYIGYAPIFLGIDILYSYIIGLVMAVSATVLFFMRNK